MEKLYCIFKIINNRLVVENLYQPQYLENEKGEHYEKLISIYNKVFGENLNFDCNFYNGVLICPRGELIEYVHMGYSSVYENYSLLKLKMEITLKEQHLTNQEFIDFKFKHFQKYKESEDIKILEETINSFKESDKELEKEFKDVKKKNKKKKKQNKYLYEKKRN